MTPLERSTGWRRPGPNAICQEWDVLMRVSIFNYNLDAPGFYEYCRARVGWGVSTEKLLEDLHPVNRAKVQDLWELFTGAVPPDPEPDSQPANPEGPNLEALLATVYSWGSANA